MNTILEIGKKAKDASYILANISTDIKNNALIEMARSLEAREDKIIEANQKDLQIARKEGLKEALIERLMLSDAYCRNG